ncbi:Acyltransferase [Zhouia amylolytica]|uniref:1-acyl-sn-glycerol-3-phosphate acyltransferase n=2 Tax=Zhouia amylolytica TaxID=376730 RepID=W2UKB0_9FLAO|nr:1-acyl-sn-glycerol-3-phosphate acyltransferase [Zhouia amylolytica]ETN94438.1 1-acyl-sn-glycerol-3-phosphate acyltransferase [Zhouia amylolytica AD3]MCQ0110337.1 1-acyl-sn-glycerol-3-phosphate acyltransferase [Zhouia amylolytica]SFT12102.1 Acyltransferase [Zhouia amylolytica]
MTKFDHIRPYKDSEVNTALEQIHSHPMIKALLHFAFPDKDADEIQQEVLNCHSIRDFQTKVIYYAVKNVIGRSSDGFSTSGFDKLDADTPYLFISNHRDIILDTSLLNVALYEHEQIMTASAIGDNLVQKPFLMALSKLNRNFLIRRGLTPREMLQSSRLVSEYIKELVTNEKRSVWIAQREGRTKDGNDLTHQGVLKMIGLAAGKGNVMEYFKNLKIVPVSISYEYDPTDMLKMPELMAKHYDKEYVKSNNEDFNSILKGATGQKKHIHISVGDVLSDELDDIANSGETLNKQYQMLADVIDEQIHKNYKLWPSNYMAYDLLNNTDRFSAEYSDKQKRQFDRRIARRVEKDNTVALQNFLAMYANPVKNKLSLD